MTHFEFIFAGFGGQGVLSMGMIMANAGAIEGKNVSWLPSYGPEMRGGTANCHVIISDEEIGSPVVHSADGIVCLNDPSFNKFEPVVKPGGVSVIDGALVERSPERTDINHFSLPATELASNAGNRTYAGIILLGKLVAKTGAVTTESFEKALKNVLPESKHHMIPEEMKLFKLGSEYKCS